VNLTSITAYRDWEAVRDQDIDFSGADRAYRDDYLVGFETVSQEIRLQGEFGRVDWLVGAYYSNEKLNLNETIRFGNDAAEYIDFFGAGFAGVQLFGTFPMSFANIVGGTPGAQPNALGAVGLTGAARVVAGNPNLTTQQAFGLAATHPDAMVRAQLQGTYTALTNLLASTTPVSGEGQNDVWGVETDTLAAFTHNEIALTDNLTLTIGVRFNHEEKQLDATVANIDLSPAPTACQIFNASLLNPAPTSTDLAVLGLIGQLGALRPLVCSPAVNEQAIGTYADTREDNEWNGTASLAYDVTDDFMVYGSYSRGYKAGGYNLDRLGFNYAITGLTGTPDPTVAPNANDLEFEPEFVDAYELGWKWNASGYLTLNGAVYMQQISDFQLLAFTGFSFVTSNVEDVVSKGVELDFQLRPFDGFTWNGGLAYNDAYYDTPATDGTEVLPSGTPLSHAPEWTVTSAWSYEHPIGEDLTMLYYLDGRWNSEYRVQTFGRNPLTDNDSFYTLNGRIALGASNEGWSLEVWGRNLTDEFYHVGGFAVPEQTTSGTGNWAIYPAEPRTWGVTLKARY
jgi:outer membrane receptor protein involved in Fe transport